MNRVVWIVEKVVFKQTLIKILLKKCSVRVVLDTYLLYRQLPLPSSCCKREACLPRSHYRGKPRVQNCVSRGKCGLRKTEKYFRLIMKRIAWIVEKVVFRKILNKFWLKRFSVRVVFDTYLLYRKLRLPRSCCKVEACLPRSHYRGKPRVQNCVSRGRCGLRKTKKILRTVASS